MAGLTNRYEILFLYECRDCNPNGDPLDENRPRTDPETGEATVTDVRIKRTVRDYILGLEPDEARRLELGREVLIRDTFKEDGTLKEGKDRAESFLKLTGGTAAKGKKRDSVGQAILTRCVDARLFGAALPMGQNEPSLQITGPVQFAAFNRSLHRVAPQLVQQTAAFAGKAGATQKSFAERWLLPYALVAAYGVVNEVSARTTGMTAEDLELLVRGLWEGTASLNTHSKIGHDPLLLLLAEYEPGHRLGALTRRVAMAEKRVEDTAIRSTADYVLDVDPLLDAFSAFPQLKALKVREEGRLRCRAAGKTGSFGELAWGRELRADAL